MTQAAATAPATTTTESANDADTGGSFLDGLVGTPPNGDTGAAPNAAPAVETKPPADATPEEAEKQARAQRGEERREKLSAVHKEAQARRERARRQEERANATVHQAEQRLADLQRRAAELDAREKKHAELERLLDEDPEAAIEAIAQRKGKRGDDLFESWTRQRLNGGKRDPSELAAAALEENRKLRADLDEREKRHEAERQKERTEAEARELHSTIDHYVTLIENVRKYDTDRTARPNSAAERPTRMRQLAIAGYQDAAKKGYDLRSQATAVAVADAIEAALAEENSERFAALGIERGSGNPSGLGAANPAGTGNPASAPPVAGTPRTITNARAASAGSVKRELSSRERAEVGGGMLIEAFPSLRTR